VIPDINTLESHARRLIEQHLAARAVADMAEELAKRAASTALPVDIEERVNQLLQRRPELPSDDAIDQIILALLSGSDG
jgi:hypothetical protein